MATKKHWSQEMYFMAWRDPRSGGRMRVSWHPTREALEALASEMGDEHDPRLYNGMGSTITIRPRQEGVDAPTRSLRAAKPKKRKPAKAA